MGRSIWSSGIEIGGEGNSEAFRPLGIKNSHALDNDPKDSADRKQMHTAIVVYNVAQAEFVQENYPCTLLAPGEAVPPSVSRLVLTRGCSTLDPLYARLSLVALESAVDAVMRYDRVHGDAVDKLPAKAYAHFSETRTNFTTRFSSAREYRSGTCLAIDERQRWLAFERERRVCVCFDPLDCPYLLQQILEENP